MANIITSTRTYATFDNAVKAIDKACAKFEITRDSLRYFVAVSPIDGRFVPTVLVDRTNMHMSLPLINCGIMVVG
jgi:hypothetical protein